MTITNLRHQFSGVAYPHIAKYLPQAGRFQLTASDRVGIERLLALGLAGDCAYPTLIEGFLRHKLRVSCPATEPTPADLVVASRRVSFMTTGGQARSGTVSFVPNDDANAIPATSFLGATLLGMRKMQKTLLLREDGDIDILVVLDVRPT